MTLKMDAQALTDFLHTQFLEVADDFTVDHIEPMGGRIRLNVGEKHLRPGGTGSGPSMFALADVAVYLCILAMIGPKALSWRQLNHGFQVVSRFFHRRRVVRLISSMS